MANELKHVSVGTEITQAEYEGTAAHVFNSQATGDIMYASSSSQLTRLGIGSTGAVLTVTGGVPAWDTTWTPTGHLIPATDDSYDLGSASAAWQDLFLEGDITLTDAGSMTTSAGALTITSAAAATWSTSAGALTLNGTGGVALQEGGSPIISISDARAVTTANTASITLDASGVIELNSSGGVLSVGNDNVDQNVNIATAGTRTLNIGINDGTDLTTITSKGNITNTGTVTVGVDDTGYDVKFFGASAGAYMEWDESDDQLRIVGPSADATTSTGKILLATALTDINANDVLGKVDFQAPLEATGTDAIAIAASIQAVAQATFTATVNSTDLLFMTGHSEAATEKFRITSEGELGVGGANYGSDGDVLTSGGAGAAPAWETPTTGDITGVTAGVGLSGGGSSGAVTLTLDLSELSTVTPADGDFFSTLDSDGANEQKTTTTALATLFAGTGLTASSSVIGVDASQTQITSVGTLGAGAISSGFGNIDIGSSTFDTTGAVTSGALTAGGILKTDDATEATSTTDGSLQTDGGLSVAKDGIFGDDVTLITDSAVLNLGIGSDVKLTHDGTTGGTLSGTPVVVDSLGASALANDTYTGIVLNFIANGTIAIGNAVYVHTADGRVAPARANAVGTMPAIGVAVTGASDGGAVKILTHGIYNDSDGFGGDLTEGATMYVDDDTAGLVTATIPDADGEFVQVLGMAVGPRDVFINPSLDIIERD